MLRVKIKKLYEDSIIPKKITQDAGAYDVYCHRIEKVEDDLVICYTGICLQPPSGYRICLVPRSSLTNHKWILGNHFGIGDADYTGEYQFRFRAIPAFIKSLNGIMSYLNYQNFPFKAGDRIGQLFLEKIDEIEFIEVEELSETERNTGGFGSSGL